MTAEFKNEFCRFFCKSLFHAATAVSKTRHSGLDPTSHAV